MDYFYDGQIRRYVTQFMRVFIGFKYKTGGSVPEERHIPVMYGDMTRQVAGTQEILCIAVAKVEAIP